MLRHLIVLLTKKRLSRSQAIFTEDGRRLGYKAKSREVLERGVGERLAIKMNSHCGMAWLNLLVTT